MLLFRTLLLAVALTPVAQAGLALADESGPSIGTVPPVLAEPTRDAQLDALFAELRTQTDESAAGRVEEKILKIWLDAESDTVNLLMDWSLQAMERKKYPRALDFLDRIILMEPGYVEGWNKRATVYFLMDDYGRSLADIAHVLELEPRHFGALSGLGVMLQEVGEQEGALAAFRAALDLAPHLSNVREALEALETETAGQDT